MGIDTSIRQDKPAYLLLADCFLDDDTLHREGERIIYPGTPNENMAPLNALAEQRMRAYLQELDDGAREKAELMGRRHNGRPTNWQDNVAQVRADTQELVKRAMPQPPAGEPSLTGVAGKTLQQRQQKAAAAGIEGLGAAPKPSGPTAQPIHRESGLKESPPLGGR